MAGHEHAHRLEYGGSPVGTEFDGSLSFKQIDRIPIFTASQTFTAQTARQIRYGLVSTWGPERPFYQRYQWVILDARMCTGWEPDGVRFTAQLRDRLRELGGDLMLVAYDTTMLEGEYLVAETLEDAVTRVKDLRAAARAAALSR